MNAVVAPLITQGQSPYVIVANHPELNISVKGLYNYINQGVLLVRDIDLKRKVKFNPRKCRREKGIDREAFIGRTHADFRALSPSHFCEMDTILLTRGSDKCISSGYSARKSVRQWKASDSADRPGTVIGSRPLMAKPSHWYIICW